MYLLQISIPVIWAIVAIVAGRLLYSYSTATVESRGIRITGAVLISMACFYGMYRATPDALLQPVPGGFRLISDAKTTRLNDLISDQQKHMRSAMHDCIGDTSNEVLCLRSLSAVQLASESLADTYRAMLRDAKP